MAKRIGMEVAMAVAEAVALCRLDMAAVYPITPNTHVAEHLSDIVAEGRIDAEFLTVESEHSAMSAVMGASATGARTFTATSSQGLMYMSEVLPIASAMRLPIVMSVANQAFKIAEHKDVMLPINFNMDGFQLTHMVEPFEMPEQSEVDKFLPEYVPYATLHPDRPVTMGALGMPEIFNEAMQGKDAAMVNSKKVILEVWKEWERMFGRKYEPVASYRTEDAEVMLLTMGSMGETAEVAIDELRKKGKAVGLLKLRLWRPFPFEELKQVVKGAKVLAVLDRAVSFGGPGGPVGSEVRSALYGEADRPAVLDYLIGLGGRDMSVEDFIAIAEKASLADKKKTKELYEFYGVRGK